LFDGADLAGVEGDDAELSGQVQAILIPQMKRQPEIKGNKIK
jgi:hypothetical protein